MTVRRPLPFALGLWASLAAVDARTADPPPAVQSPDWPCEQILVPQVSAAAVWDGPPVEGLAWRASPQVAALVASIASPATSEAAAQTAIADFAGTLGDADRDRMLTLAFAGVLEVLNRDRANLIAGIERYARDQSRRAERLGQELDRMVLLEQDDSEAAAQAR